MFQFVFARKDQNKSLLTSKLLLLLENFKIHLYGEKLRLVREMWTSKFRTNL